MFLRKIFLIIKKVKKRRKEELLATEVIALPKYIVTSSLMVYVGLYIEVTVVSDLPSSGGMCDQDQVQNTACFNQTCSVL